MRWIPRAGQRCYGELTSQTNHILREPSHVMTDSSDTQSTAPSSECGSNVNMSCSAPAPPPDNEMLIGYMRHIQRQLAMMRREIRRGHSSIASASLQSLRPPKGSGDKQPKPRRKPRTKARKALRPESVPPLAKEKALILPPLMPRPSIEPKRHRPRRRVAHKESDTLPPIGQQTGHVHWRQKSE
ncbi:hypothetical protein LSAT2_006587 [Lamellibrachia satsuma]|nr:hypothetical protein LSAT2_006587 [Lamellibrachia satsuma]